MKNMDSTEAKTHFGALLDAAQRAPVRIKKKGRPVAVMTSCEDYEYYEQLKIEDINRKLQDGIDALDRGEWVDGETFMKELLEGLE